MKKLAISILLIAGLVISTNASAFWNNNNYNECWGNSYDCNPYDPWDPRYWFEEMESFFDDDDYPRYGHPMPYRHPMPYGHAPGHPQGYQAAPGQVPYQMPHPQQMPYMPRPPYYGPQMPRPGMQPQPAPAAPKQPAVAPQEAPAAEAPKAAQAK